MEHRARTTRADRPTGQAVCRAQAGWGVLLFSLAMVWSVSSPARAQTAPPTKKPAAAKSAQADADAGAALTQRQQQLAAQYDEFEKKLLRIAELTAGADPRRAALLRRVVAESKQRRVSVQIEQIAESLRDDKLAGAVTAQQALEEDLGRLLEMMLAEQRGDRLKDEQQKIKEQLRKIRELIQRQGQLQGRTEAADDANELAEAQGKLADETGRLAEQMRKPDDKPAKPGDKAEGANKDDKRPAADKKPEADQRPDNDKKSDGGKKPNDGDKPAGDAQKKPGDKKPGDKSADDKQSQDQKPGDKSAEGKPSENKESQPSAEESQEQSGPGQAQQRVAAAQKKMAEARRKIEEAKRKGAQEDQQSALRDLEMARAELEEILRQSREEEVERVLAELESRFEKMREMQIEVREGTKPLAQVAAAERRRDDEIKASALARRESQIESEAERTLILLREEGSAVAMVEAVEQLRDDMHLVVVRLSQAKADERTVAIETDIIAALEELIASVKKAQKDAENRRSQPGGGGAPQDPPLVDKLSELKVIRSLQMRINQRTKRYTDMLKDEVGQAEEPELLELLRELAVREQRVYEATRDIVAGKNK